MDKKETALRNKVCVYAICRNESMNVKKWYDSMSEADYVCVLDTGSTDDTYSLLEEIASGNNKIVIDRKQYPEKDGWRFDDARNLSMRLIPEDANILVCTDLDEVFESGWADVLRQEWTPTTERAYYKYTWSHDESGRELRTFIYDKIHSRNWHWEYPVHETLVNKEGDDTSSNCEVVNLFDKIHLHHYPDNTKSRSSYLPLLELRKKENPDDYYGRIYLAHEYNYRGKYDESNKEFKDILNKFKGKMTSIEEASCHLFMGENYTVCGKYYEAAKEYEKGIHCEDTIRECYLGLAEVYLELGEYEECISVVNECLLKTYRHFSWLERDKSWTVQPWDLLCIAYYFNKDFEKAVFASAKALEYEHSDVRLQKNVVECIKHYSESELVELLDEF